MHLVQVRFAFPFRVAVPGDVYWLVYDGKGYYVKASDLVGIREHLLGTDRSAVTEGRKSVWYRTIANIGPRKQETRKVQYVEDPDAFVAVVQDFIGFTFLTVTFETQDLPDTEAVQDALYDEAIAVAGRFVNTYREVSNDLDLFYPTLEDSFGAEIWIGKDGYVFSEVEGLDCEVRFHTRKLRWLPPHLTGLAKEPLSPERSQILIQRLREDTPVPLPVELLLDAKQYSALHRNHRMAVVACSSSFEAFLQDRLRSECRVRGIETLWVGTGLKARQHAVSTLVEDGSLTRDLLGTLGGALVPEGIKGVHEYQQWRKRCYTLRNEIVHEGRREVSEDQSQEAFEATVAYMNRVSTLLASSRSGWSAPKGPSRWTRFWMWVRDVRRSLFRRAF